MADEILEILTSLTPRCGGSDYLDHDGMNLDNADRLDEDIGDIR